jgi:2-oxoglutarate/2-oxoacid ferredoxin oxidoreductase subunit alpha
MTTSTAPKVKPGEPLKITSTNQITIGIVGSGGDGVIASGEILADAAAREGLYCIMTKSIGPAIRGGESSCRVRMGDTRVHSQGDKVDVLVCFNWDDFKLFQAELFLKQNCVILYPEENPLEPDQLPIEKGLDPVVIKIPFLKLAKDVIGNELTKNIVMLGVLAGMFDLPKEGLENAIRHRFARKGEKVIEMNLSALKTGGDWVKEHVAQDLPIRFFYTTAPPKLLMTGNDAIAYGALHAGCRFLAGYPITPATEIFEWLAANMPKYGGTVVQCEDEIAAVSMAVGASFAGIPAMTSSSGPGVSLMQEMIGGASMAEIPLVVVNVQRGGPATGLPTKSEQADLMQAIHGGHGDGPRVVLAPCDTEDCYDIIHHAFSISEAFQIPVMVLSDQFIGQRKASFDSFDVNRVPVEKRRLPNKAELENYERFRLSGTGVSPMSNPGIKGGQYQASGIAHGITGNPTSRADLNTVMNEKRYHKLEHILERYPLFNYYGQKGASLGILGWGSSKGVIREAVHLCSRAGIDVCGMVPRILHPLPVQELEDWFDTLSTLIVVEVSFTGQFLEHVRSQINLPQTVAHFAMSGGALLQLEDVINLVIEHSEEEITADMEEIIDPGGIYKLGNAPKVNLIVRGEVCE